MAFAIAFRGGDAFIKVVVDPTTIPTWLYIAGYVFPLIVVVWTLSITISGVKAIEKWSFAKSVGVVAFALFLFAVIVWGMGFLNTFFIG